MTTIDPFAVRRAGILLHPTSLPGEAGHGTLGEDACRFVDFLVSAGQSVWQMLPLGPTHENLSPYQCLSLYAGNPALISIERLVTQGWLTPPATGTETSRQSLHRACDGFLSQADDQQRDAWQTFCQDQQFWLDDYSLFQVIREQHDHADWTQWPAALRDRHPEALDDVREKNRQAFDRVCVEQYFFFSQWRALKQYANERGILLFGDMPIFVAHDSADVWAGRRYFDLDPHGQPRVVAGVPPDYFSATGQRWGNPHYLWSVIEAEDFAWWRRRLAMQLDYFDLVRIDHFRGFESYWEIPAHHDTAMEGRWIKAPGKQLFKTLCRDYRRLPLVAEDLGIITAEVEKLRDRFKLPGMKILQFAFDGHHDNPYLPHNHVSRSVVYTGTHDNDTTSGWYHGLSKEQRRYVREYLGFDRDDAMPWPLIRAAMASVAQMAMIPMQDVLALDSKYRMNTPGTETGNWLWRFDWEQVTAETASRLFDWSRLYQRLVMT